MARSLAALHPLRGTFPPAAGGSVRQKGHQVCREFRDDEGVIEMTKMRWHLVKLHGRPSLDFRREFEFEDRAAKWLAERAAVLARRNQARSDGGGSDDCSVTLSGSEVTLHGLRSETHHQSRLSIDHTCGGLSR